MNSIWIIQFLFFIPLIISFNNADGHGLSTDISNPIDILDKKIVVETTLEPPYVNSSLDFTDSKFFLRIYDKLTNQTVSNVDYDIKILSDKELLLNLCIRSSNGFFTSKLVPLNQTGTIISNNTNQLNSKDCINNISQNDRFEIRSKILSHGGLYHLSVTLKKTSEELLLQKDMVVDLFVSIGEDHYFNMQESSKKNTITIKSYYDSLRDINYHRENNTLSFNMPFNWNQTYIQQMDYLHIEVALPKLLEIFNTNNYGGMVFGKNLPKRSLVIDDYSDLNSRIIHLVLNKDQLDQLSRQISQNNNITNNQILTPFKLYTIDEPQFPLDILTSTEKFLFQISWNPSIITPSTPINFIMNLQNPKTGDLERHSSFDFVIMDKDKIIYRENLKSHFGAFAFEYSFPKDISNNPKLIIDKINGDNENAVLNLYIN
ncbi:MAG: hypothetical protein ACE5SW_00350 [Nitrososphaeraceae archaeon]